MVLKLKGKPPEQSKPSKPKLVLYGRAGVGKTWFSLEFPNVYYIDAEGGAKEPHYIDKLKKSGSSYFGIEDGALDFQEVIDQMKALSTFKHNYKTVVIDSVSKLFNNAVAVAQEELGDKDAFGASKKAAVAYMRQLIRWVNRIDMNVILICHERPEWGMVFDEKTKKKERQEIGSTLDCWEKLEYELDLVLRLFKTESGKRMMTVPRKSRVQSFPEGILFEGKFSEFAERYGDRIIQRETEAVALASKEQVKEINHLIAVCKTNESTIARWLSAANAASWDELNQEQAEKTINALQSQPPRE